MTDRVASFVRLFGAADRRDLRLDAIGAEARDRGVDPFDLDAFLKLAESRSALKELMGTEPDPNHPVTALLFHAFHFRKGGARVVVIPDREVRSLIRHEPDKSWSPTSEPGAGYVRFSEGLIRVAGGDGGPRPWLGGFYWVYGAGRLLVLAELFSAPQEFSFLPLPPLPSSAVSLWVSEPVREAGNDFTDPAGATDDGQLHIAVAAEILKLAVLTLWVRDVPVVQAPSLQSTSDTSKANGNRFHA